MRYSPKEAAARAGYQNPEKSGLKLMSRSDIATRIKELTPCHTSRSEVEAALRRLAFGGIGDVIKLITAENPIELDHDRLELLQIAELKYSKNGVEVKLFDRIKALQTLAQLAEAAEEGGDSGFFQALNKSAGRLQEEDYAI